MKRLPWFLLLGLLSISTSGFADYTDFHVGSFNGTWCNYKARFDVESRGGDSWIFNGKILIHQTGQYDPIRIEQYSDQSLRIVRYLQGDRRGQTQVVRTYSPAGQVSSNQVYQVFQSQQGYGYGCVDTSSNLWMWQS